MQARLYRSRTDSMIAGVCGGLGQYLGVDTTLVRLAFVLLGLTSGFGVLAYLVMWVAVPREDSSVDTYGEGAREMAEQARSLAGSLRGHSLRSNPQFGLYAGAALVLVGALLLAENFGIYLPHWLGADLIWPLVLIAAGIALIRGRVRTA